MGQGGASVNEFFTMNPNLKYKKRIFFFLGGGGGRGGLHKILGHLQDY